METISKEEFKTRYPATGLPSNLIERPNSLQVVKDIAIGAAKGLGETAFETGNILTEGGRFIQAAIDPTKTIQDIRTGAAERGIDPFSGTRQETIRTALEADNPAQMAGKRGEFALELLFPVSKISKVTGLTEKGTASISNLIKGAANLSDDLVEGGIKVKDRILDVVSDLDDKTKTALERTPRQYFENVLEQGKQAMTDDRIRTPLENVGENIISGLRQAQEQLRSIGAQKGRLLENANIGFMKVGNIAGEARLQLQKIFSEMKLDDADQRVINTINDQLTLLGQNPRLKDVDETIDLLQDTIYKNTRPGAIEITDRVTGQLRKVIGELNEKIKDIAGEQYRGLNQEYSERFQFINELNARLGKEGASAGAYVKRLFSPSDARTKELLEQLQKYTGGDYFRDARVAKFVMDVLGDTRAASLLKQIPESASGAIGKVIEFAKEKLADPIEAARRFIKKKGPGTKNQLPAAIGGSIPDEEGQLQSENLLASLGIAFAGSLTKTSPKEARKIIDRLEKERAKFVKAAKDKDVQGELERIESAIRYVQQYL